VVEFRENGMCNRRRRPHVPYLAAVVVVVAGAASSTALAGTWQRVTAGVVVTPDQGPARKVRVLLMSDRTVRVTATPRDRFEAPQSLMVTAQPDASVAYEAAARGDTLVLKAPKLTVEIGLATGAVGFRNARGQLILAEQGDRTLAPVTVQGTPFFAIAQRFNRGTDEGFYGLGQHQNGLFDYNGADVDLAQHNIVDVVPFVVSTRNYGVLWDNNGVSRFGDPREYEPLDRALDVFDAGGKRGGLTGRYYRGGEVVLTRTEADPDYQYLPADQFTRLGGKRGAWPAEFGERSPSRITWEGSIASPQAGTHKFRVYSSSYFKLWVDGTLLVDRWRQNWNPWYDNVELTMSPGTRRAIRIDWTPDDGYFRLLHLAPLPPDEQRSLTLSSDVAHHVDYYVVAGESLDEVIDGYRQLTGPALMLPRWAYGFWQSRQRYATQRDLLDVVREYRRLRLPLDNIVQDWFYWPEDAWGSHEFDASRFPDPKGMVDEVHALNARLMISVWPKFYPATRNYQELDAKGYIYRRQIAMQTRDWVGPGYLSSFYDPYPEDARRIYWRQIRERLGVLGVDAWWMDATEPDMHSNLSPEERALRMGPTSRGPGAELFNSYVLPNSQAIFEGEQSVDPDRRVFLLTRSTYGGLQRYGATSWSGDVGARWETLREQISAGVNLSMSGLPNWTHDIGGFATEGRYAKQDPAHLAEWRELYLRWFQFGAFTPLFRAHGEVPFREIYNVAPPGSEIYDHLARFARLRYRLLPYIYTLAADTYFRNGTIMRGLIMDFPADPRVRRIGTQYLFGPSFLVTPVTEYGARTTRLYLPAGARWFDFYTGAVEDGGREIDAAAPLDRMPLFVRAGSIVPIGPAVEYTSQNLEGPITLLVYTGAHASFALYEDDGVTYAHQRGAFARVPISYDEASGAVTIGARAGEFPGMVTERTFNVRWISGPSASAGDLDAGPDATVRYTGAAVTVQRPSR
jgi:alpha-D-xyloside xylohydrolase